jgi:hypothetical protein
MRRVVSIWFSTLPTDRLRQRGNVAPKGASSSLKPMIC